MILPLQKFAVLLENMSAGVQAGSAQLIDLSVGSVLRALLEACAAVALWMQWLILQVLLMTRAATSTGADLDSWMADFSLPRLPGTQSQGSLTFRRYTPGAAATILPGAAVSTNDASQAFVVTADPANPAWNNAGGYTVGPTVISVTLPAQARIAGAGGNVQAGSIGLLTSAIPGIDTVSNQMAFAGGSDPESDAALRARFQLYINTRSLATLEAVAFAVASVRQGLRYVVLENESPSGAAAAGHFWVVVDDGTGVPGASLLGAVTQAVDAVRPIGSTFSVTGPQVVGVAIELAVITSNALTRAAVLVGIQSAISAWVAGLPIAGTLAISKLEALAHGADPSVVSVISASINGAATNVTAPANGVLLATSIGVS